MDRQKMFYVAGRARYRGDECAHVQDLLEQKGWKPVFDWVQASTDGVVKKPYIDHPKNSYALGNKMIEAAHSADLVILLHDADLEGALMEYGAARHALLSQSEKQIVVVRLGARDSIFLHGDRITLLDSFDKLFEWIDQHC